MTTNPVTTLYTPSPRPAFEQPTLITRANVTTHVWGDDDAGLVADWIYASTESLHMIIFGLAPGTAFTHSPEFRTVFNSDEVFYVLQGAMMACNPETGEATKHKAGDFLFFRKDTWHHVFAEGDEPLRVVEFLSPPPASGSTGAYSRTRPYLDDSKYGRAEAIGQVPLGDRPAASLMPRPPETWVWHRDGDVSLGIVASTEHLTVGVAHVPPAGRSRQVGYGGDALLLGLDGELHVRCWQAEKSQVFVVGHRDAVFLPEGCKWELMSFGAGARALIGVSPSFLPRL